MNAADAEVMERGEGVVAERPADPGALVARVQGAGMGGGFLDILIDRAMRRPRSPKEFVDTVTAAALYSDETAGDCLYGLPRADKVIEGPSVRLAEILVPAWRYSFASVQAMPVGPKDLDVTSVATFLDLQSLTGIQVESKRRITGQYGRYNEDMIVMTQNANNSLAYRNVVFKSIPRALWWPIYEKARVKALGEGGTIPQKRQQMIDWFGKMGITPQQILARLKVVKITDINVDQLVTLKGLGNAVKEGEISVQQAFSVDSPLGDAPTRESLEEKLKGRNGTGPAAGSDQDIAGRAKAKKAEQDAATQGDAPGIANLSLLEDLARERKVDPEKYDAAVAEISAGPGTPEERRELLKARIDTLTPKTLAV